MTRCLLTYHPLTSLRDRYGLLPIQYAILGKVETEVPNHVTERRIGPNAAGLRRNPRPTPPGSRGFGGK